MIRNIAIALVIVMLAVLALGLLTSANVVSIAINGHELSGPFKVVAGAWGLVLAAVILACVAILLAFVFAGVGLVVLGCLVLVGFVLAAVAFPFLLPLLIPLLIVWAFCAGARRGKTLKT
jgi:hypothetical protein